ncbi:SIMPL domain-containing protein [Flavobacterium sp. RHBU_24]|uniref:SIMPL domain-containing protein n=1 Tax=Flavobacterium sp. RHBU_24 TaxID=3391185 RepID=UPI0039853413
MKQLLLFLFVISSLFANAQQPADNTKFIEVNGSAEISLRPDEVEFEVNLMQYHDGKKWVAVDEVEKEFYAVLEKNGVPVKALTADNAGIYASYSYYYWWHWWYYYRNQTDRKVVRFTVKQNTDILTLMKDFNEKKWLDNLSIVSSKSTDILKYRKQVKIEAIKAARDKAEYLLESIGEELDGIISVVEVPEVSSTGTGNYPYYDRYNGFIYGGINGGYRQQSTSSNVVLNAGSMSRGGSNDTGIQNMAEIKVRYEIKAKFKIK